MSLCQSMSSWFLCTNLCRAAGSWERIIMLFCIMESNLARIGCQLECRLHSLIGLQDFCRLQRESCVVCIIFSLYRSVVGAEQAMHVLAHQAMSLRFIIGGFIWGRSTLCFCITLHDENGTKSCLAVNYSVAGLCISAMHWLVFGRLLCFPFFYR